MARKSSVKVKKACCKSRPRCKRCPVALRRLEAAGLAERTGKRTYALSTDLGKQAFKVARAP